MYVTSSFTSESSTTAPAPFNSNYSHGNYDNLDRSGGLVMSEFGNNYSDPSALPGVASTNVDDMSPPKVKASASLSEPTVMESKPEALYDEGSEVMNDTSALYDMGGAVETQPAAQRARKQQPSEKRYDNPSAAVAAAAPADKDSKRYDNNPANMGEAVYAEGDDR